MPSLGGGGTICSTHRALALVHFDKPQGSPYLTKGHLALIQQAQIVALRQEGFKDIGGLLQGITQLLPHQCVGATINIILQCGLLEHW